MIRSKSLALRKPNIACKCGIIGMVKKSGNVNKELCMGLLMLQHRGQDSAGMVTSNIRDTYEIHKSKGLVNDVFADEKIIDKLVGNFGIAHVRYPTAGSKCGISGAQPFHVDQPSDMFLVHNGNLTNVDNFMSKWNMVSDSQVLLNIFADQIDPHSPKEYAIASAIKQMMDKLQGSFSCLTLIHDVGLVAFRDPRGIRPLVLGHREGDWCVASEDCAFAPMGFVRVRDVNPGELIIIGNDGKFISMQVATPTTKPCIFEYVYLARPDSNINDISVHEFHMGLGHKLAERLAKKKWNVDIVTCIPDGARYIAHELAKHAGLPFQEAFVKNRYVGRTFIMPDQSIRENAVKLKLNPIPNVFEGKNVLLVDDSIVRGTTMIQVVKMARMAGARKVYIASASPPVRYPNVYGIDIPNKTELVANGLSQDEICTVLGADGVLYQTVEDMVAIGKKLNPRIIEFETSCFDGNYI